MTRHTTHRHIFSLNADVDLHNTRRLNALPAQPVTIQAFDRWPARWTERSTADAEKRSGLATFLTVIVGARVVLVRNVETKIGLFNRALGTVIGFDRRPPALPTAILVLFDNQRLPTVATERLPSLGGAFPVERAEARFPLRQQNSVLDATRLQFPLKVAFASTIHKCQGQTLSSAVVSLKGHFGPGQAYVALSRCKTIDNLFITDFNSKCFKPNKGGLHAFETMIDELPLGVPHNTWIDCGAHTFRLAMLRDAESISASLYLSVCDVAVYTESRMRHNEVPAKCFLLARPVKITMSVV